jgi:hypothetical protein
VNDSNDSSRDDSEVPKDHDEIKFDIDKESK